MAATHGTLFQLASMVENFGDMIGDADVELKGMPVSVGEVTGMARVVTNLQDAHTIQVSVNIIIYHFHADVLAITISMVGINGC